MGQDDIHKNTRFHELMTKDKMNGRVVLMLDTQ